MVRGVSSFAKGRRALAAAGVAAALIGLPLAAQVSEKVDYDAIMRIKDEGFGRSSRVMEFASWLTDVHGPRLDELAADHKAAGEYVKKQMTELGFANVKLEPWGPFGRGWSNDYTHVRVVAPFATTLHGVLQGVGAWHQRSAAGGRRPGHAREGRGPGEGPGAAEGKFVLLQPAAEVKPLFDAPGRRYTDEDLDKLTRESPTRGGMRGGRRPSPASPTRSPTWRPRRSSARSAPRSSGRGHRRHRVAEHVPARRQRVGLRLRGRAR